MRTLASSVPPWEETREPWASAVLTWLRLHLFGSMLSTLATALMAAALAIILPPLLRWLWLDSTPAPGTLAECKKAGGACWAFLQAKYRLILFGTYPYQEQWRPAAAIVLFLGIAAVTAWQGLRGRPARRRALLPLWLGGLTLIAALMWGGVAGLSRVEVRLWAGLPLTMMLAVVGALSAFWLAILLALGRRSRLPVVRWVCTGYIEIIRGVPLIGLIFMAAILFPLILPPHLDVDKLLRAQFAFAMFFAAYMAEAIRGGLQAIPRGQYEAADAIGLTYWQATRRIILPQALRLSIPALVNIFIGAFKDTSLVLVISMLDLLGTANAAKGDAAWWGLYVEAYFAVGLIYLVFCAAMSWYSQRLEARLRRGAA